MVRKLSPHQKKVENNFCLQDVHAIKINFCPHCFAKMIKNLDVQFMNANINELSRIYYWHEKNVDELESNAIKVTSVKHGSFL